MGPRLRRLQYGSKSMPVVVDNSPASLRNLQLKGRHNLILQGSCAGNPLFSRFKFLLISQARVRFTIPTGAQEREV